MSPRIPLLTASLLALGAIGLVQLSRGPSEPVAPQDAGVGSPHSADGTTPSASTRAAEGAGVSVHADEDPILGTEGDTGTLNVSFLHEPGSPAVSAAPIRVDGETAEPVPLEAGLELTWHLAPGRYRLYVPDVAIVHDPPQEPFYEQREDLVHIRSGDRLDATLSGEFTIRPGRTTELAPRIRDVGTVTGVVFGCGSSGTVRLRRRPGAEAGKVRDFRSVADIEIGADGSFELENVAAGDWSIQALRRCPEENRIEFIHHAFTRPEGLRDLHLGVLSSSGLTIDLETRLEGDASEGEMVELGMVQRRSTDEGIKIHDRFHVFVPGGIQLTGLPPGEYFFESIFGEPRGWQRPEVVTALAGERATMTFRSVRQFEVTAEWTPDAQFNRAPVVLLTDEGGDEFRLVLRTRLGDKRKGSTLVPGGTYSARLTQFDPAEVPGFPDVSTKPSKTIQVFEGAAPHLLFD